MGQKVNPIGIRLGISREHNSVWYAEKNKYQQYKDRNYKNFKKNECKY